MSAMMKTKYATVGVDVDDTSIPDSYFGYISVTMDLNSDEANFFAEIFEHELLDGIRNLFKSVPNVMVEKDIRWEDASILIDLPSTRTKVYAADTYKLVKELEQKFQERTGL